MVVSPSCDRSTITRGFSGKPVRKMLSAPTPPYPDLCKFPPLTSLRKNVSTSDLVPLFINNAEFISSTVFEIVSNKFA